MLQYLSSWFREEEDDDQPLSSLKTIRGVSKNKIHPKNKEREREEDQDQDEELEDTDFQKDKKRYRQKQLPLSSSSTSSSSFLPAKIKKVRKSVRFFNNVHSKTKKRNRY